MSQKLLILILCLACGQDPTTAPASGAEPAEPASRPTTRPDQGSVAGYELGRAVRSYELPASLREVSSIEAVDDRTIACLQDELGSLFFFDLASGRVVREVRFGPPGDYEGLTRAGDDWWVLRSDGVLLQVRPAGDELAIHATHTLVSRHADWESLAADRDQGSLLVAPKDLLKDGTKEDRDQRPVHVFSLKTRSLAAQPLLVASARRLSDAVEAGEATPGAPRGKGRKQKNLKLRFAEIAVHPDTGDLWLLSAVDRLLLVIDRSGGVRGVRRFTDAELPKPEALAFLPDGRLAIASEGVDGPAVLRIYDRSK